MSDEQAYPESELQRAGEVINQMTPETYLEMESMLNAYDEAPNIPEAGGIAFTEFEGDHGGVLHVTARAMHPTRAVQMLLESFQHLRSLQPGVHWHIPSSGGIKSKPISTPVPQSAPNPAEPQYVNVDTEKPATPATPQGQVQQYAMQIAKIEITPKPDSRVDVMLYAPGHKWPDLRIVNWNAQQVLENIVDPALGWDINTMQTANEFTGNYAAIWQHSTTRTNTKGEPYKDVQVIRLG